MTTPDAKPDLDAQIRDAEARVIAADRDWQLHNDQLGAAIREHAGRAARIGGGGIAALIGSAIALRLGLKARERKRETMLAKALAKMRWPSAASRATAAAAAAPPKAVRSPLLGSAIAMVGALLGAGLRTGLKLPARPGIVSVLVGVAGPMLTRWWRARDPRPPAPASKPPPQTPQV